MGNDEGETMAEDAGCLANGGVGGEPIPPEGGPPTMEEGVPFAPATGGDGMAGTTAGPAQTTPGPGEMPAVDEAMAEAQAAAGQETAGACVPTGVRDATPTGFVLPLAQDGIDVAALEPHPLADLLPRMSEPEFADLRESIELDGLQNSIVLYRGRILDGRNRYRACRELGVPVTFSQFVGTEQQALTYVLSSNQHRRHLTASQRAVVANEAQPMVAVEVNAKRIEKIRQARLQQLAREFPSILTGSPDSALSPTESRAIAADMMGVSSGYVSHARRIKEADPELYRGVRAGRVTIPAALRKLDGVVDDPQAVRSIRAKRAVAKLLGDPDRQAEFLERLEGLLAEFA